MASQRYFIDSEGRPEDAESRKMWSVIDSETYEVVASWRQTPITGLTEEEAQETADAWNAQ